MEALHQITRNAVMHRTYEATNAPVHVYWFNDRIEVLSPGGAFGAVTIERFGEPGLVDLPQSQMWRTPCEPSGLSSVMVLAYSSLKTQLAAAGHPELEFDVSTSFVRATVKARGKRNNDRSGVDFLQQQQKSGVGKTSLVYHLAWMLSDLGYRVLACDLDPQANLTAAFLDEDQLEKLSDDGDDAAAKTILQCVRPLTKGGDSKDPTLAKITSELSLIPGDLVLARFEDALSSAWA